MFEASCHCGNINLQVDTLPEYVVSCNCSKCHRTGAEWAYFAPEQVSVTTTSRPTETYRWGDKYIDFHHCPICGSNTHYTSTEKCEPKRVGVNMRMVDRSVTATIAVRKFDGAESWTFIEDQAAIEEQAAK